MVYKIGLLSTHGTGKTTAAHDVAGLLKKCELKLTVRVISELSTIARERSIPVDQRTTLDAQAWILTRQVSAELESAIYSYDVAICDRTVFDNYCYMKNAIGENDHYLQFILGHSRQHLYGRLYYLPITEELDSKKRDPDPVFQKKIDDSILEFLTAHNIEYTKLPLDRNTWPELIAKQTISDLKSSGKYR